MHLDKRPLFSLTVAEYLELLKSLYSEIRNDFESPQEIIKEEPEHIFIEEAAKLTGYTEKTIYTKVCRKEIPYVSSGRPLTFSRKQLNEWMANGRPTITEMIAMDFMNNKKRK